MSLKLFTPFLSLLLLSGAAAAADTDNISLPPAYTHEGTVYIPPEPQRSLLPATDKTAKNSKITKKMTATASIKAGPLILDIIFADAHLEACVLAAATTNGWTLCTIGSSDKAQLHQGQIYARNS